MSANRIDGEKVRNKHLLRLLLKEKRRQRIRHFAEGEAHPVQEGPRSPIMICRRYLTHKNSKTRRKEGTYDRKRYPDIVKTYCTRNDG
jgi:hypothetical protein